MSHLRITDSSWITGIQYVPMDSASKEQARSLGERGDGLLVVATASGKTGWLVPSWLFGLLAATKARGASVGRAVNKLVKGKYPSVKIN